MCYKLYVRSTSMDEWEKLRKQWLDMLLGDTEDVCMFPDKVAETDKELKFI